MTNLCRLVGIAAAREDERGGDPERCHAGAVRAIQGRQEMQGTDARGVPASPDLNVSRASNLQEPSQLVGASRKCVSICLPPEVVVVRSSVL